MTAMNTRAAEVRTACAEARRRGSRNDVHQYLLENCQGYMPQTPPRPVGIYVSHAGCKQNPLLVSSLCSLCVAHRRLFETACSQQRLPGPPGQGRTQGQHDSVSRILLSYNFSTGLGEDLGLGIGLVFGGGGERDKFEPRLPAKEA